MGCFLSSLCPYQITIHKRTNHPQIPKDPNEHIILQQPPKISYFHAFGSSNSEQDLANDHRYDGTLSNSTLGTSTYVDESFSTGGSNISRLPRALRIGERGEYIITKDPREDSESRSMQDRVEFEVKVQIQPPGDILTPPTSCHSALRLSSSTTQRINEEAFDTFPSLQTMAPLINTLTSAISKYSEHMHLSRLQTLHDLNSIITRVPSSASTSSSISPIPILIKPTLTLLTTDISTLFNAKLQIHQSEIAPIKQDITDLWNEFIEMEEDEMIFVSENLPKSSCLMKIFALLAKIGMAIEKIDRVEREIEARVEGVFEGVLRGLGGMEEDHGQGGKGKAKMAWRVLGIVVGGRGERERDLGGLVVEGRMAVSKGLLGVVEEVSESGDGSAGMW